MKVAYIMWYYNGSVEGLYARIHDVLHSLRERSNRPFDADIYATRVKNPDGMVEPVPPSRFENDRLDSITSLRTLRSEIASESYDVVNFLDFKLYWAFAGAVDDAAVFVGPNLGGWYPNRHGGKWNTTGCRWLRQRAMYALQKLIATTADYDRVLAFSQYHRSMLTHLGIDAAAVTVLRPGVSDIFSVDGRQENPGDPPKLLYVGYPTEHKGYSLLLRALERVEHPFEFRAVGLGDFCEEELVKREIRDRTSLTGALPRDELPDVYRSADLLVVPSIDETGGPTTQVEALACGTPVVATDRPGINEYAPDRTAVYFDPYTPEALAEAIEQALGNIETLLERAREHAPRFSARRTVDQLADIYRDTITGGT